MARFVVGAVFIAAMFCFEGAATAPRLEYESPTPQVPDFDYNRSPSLLRRLERSPPRFGPEPSPFNPRPNNPGPYNPGPYNPGPYNPGPYNPGPYNPGERPSAGRGRWTRGAEEHISSLRLPVSSDIVTRFRRDESASSRRTSDDGRTSFDTHVHRGRDGSGGADLVLSQKVGDSSSLYGQLSGNTNNDFSGKLGLNHDVNDRTSLGTSMFKNDRGLVVGDVSMSHRPSDSTTFHARAYGNNYGEHGGSLGVSRSLSDRTSLNANMYGNNRGDVGGSVGVDHHFNDRTSIGASTFANNRGEYGGQVGVKHTW